MTGRLMRAEAVRRQFDPPCGREAAYKLIRRLGGWYEPDVGWVVLASRVQAYLKSRERGAREETCDQEPRASTAYPSTHAKDDGFATSGCPTAADESAPSTSEPMAAKRASAPPKPPTGKSKHELRLEKLIESARQRKRLAQHSRPSAQNKSSRSSEKMRTPKPTTSGET